MRKLIQALLGAVALPAAIAASNIPVVGAACGPCRPKSSTPCRPCAAKNAKSPCNPCAAKNPCNPCSAGGLPVPKASDLMRPAGIKPFRAKRSVLVKMGEKLFSDTALSTNEMSCNSCHSGFSNYNETFKKPFPHFVQMAKDVSGLDALDAEQMVQFCIIRPMMSKPLPWDSKELAALTAYVLETRKQYAKR